jgi:hypothetical protein
MAKSKLLIAAELRIASLEARIEVGHAVCAKQRAHIIELEAIVGLRAKRAETQRSAIQHFGQRTVKRYMPVAGATA